MSDVFNVEKVVRETYTEGAKENIGLCCPTSYDPKYLKVLPQEIIERDYGCGNPTSYLKEGEVVLDLGSGGGKICYIAAQVVGPKGCIIGVDMNEEMLALARKYQKSIGDKLGYHNVEFRHGKIQDLKTDYDRVAEALAKHPIRSLEDWQALQDKMAQEAQATPLIRNSSVDVLISNCVLNLVRPEYKKQLFAEMFRVLKKGGRAVISDIVSDEEAADSIKSDPKLWSGCIAGAFEERAFLKAFEEAGFYGIQILKREQTPWQTIEGMEFRSMTIQAHKGKQGPCWETNKAVLYKGPWNQVKDDDNHSFVRGVPMAVCEKTFKIMTSEPYADDTVPILPLTEIPLDKAKPFDCSVDAVRDPRQTKGLGYKATTEASSSACCPPGTCC